MLDKKVYMCFIGYMITFEEKQGIKYRFKYSDIARDLAAFAEKKDVKLFKDALRTFSKEDLFFFCYFILGLHFLNNKWGVERCYDVQSGYSFIMDMWARGHYKSTIKTFALPLWEIIKNPEQRIAIYSHTREQARAFLSRIRNELEQNVLLKSVFDDVFYCDPKEDAPIHSRDMVCVKRKGNYNEATFEAWGLMKGMPTGKHFTISIYDDLVTEKSVSNYAAQELTRQAFQLSRNLVSDNEVATIQGTFYSFDDLYVRLVQTGVWQPRVYPGTVDGTPDGDGVLLTKDELQKKRQEMGEYVFATQILLKPIPDDDIVFKLEWLKFYDSLPRIPMNVYLMVDPSGDREWNKNDDFDWCVMIVIGVDRHNNRYLLDMVRDKLSLTQRWDVLRDLYLRWSPIRIGYEKYGMQVDLSYISERSIAEGVTIPRPIALRGSAPKVVRIRKLVPLFETGRMYLPRKLSYTDVSGARRNLIQEFIDEEYTKFPKSLHYDMLDCLARQMDDEMGIAPPFVKDDFEVIRTSFDPFKGKQRINPNEWMGW